MMIILLIPILIAQHCPEIMMKAGWPDMTICLQFAGPRGFLKWVDVFVNASTGILRY